MLNPATPNPRVVFFVTSVGLTLAGLHFSTPSLPSLLVAGVAAAFARYALWQWQQ